MGRKRERERGREAELGPDLGAAVFEELQKLGDHDVEGPVESVTVQQLRRVLTDLLKSSEGTLGREGGTVGNRGKEI